MKIIDRYIGKEILVTTLFAVGVLSLVLVFGNLFKQLLNQDVPLPMIFSIASFILPFSLMYSIPWGFLTAVLLIFGKLSSENELVALRSNGVSIPRICVPVATLAMIATGICFWINMKIAPHAQEKMKNAFCELATSNPMSLFGSDHVIDEFPDKKIYVERKEGANLYNILVYELGDHNLPSRVVQAQKAVLKTDLKGQQILMELVGAQFEQRDTQDTQNMASIKQGITMKQTTFPISLQALYEKNKNRRKASQMEWDELFKLKDKDKVSPEDISAAMTEANKRFSLSLASLALALVAVPLAVTAQRKETSIGFLFSLLVGLGFFSFIQIADNLRNNPKAHPELLMWAPNVIFITLGAILFYRLAKR